MKHLTRTLFAGSLAILIAACANTPSASNGGNAKEQLLAEAGFQKKSITQPNQQKRLAALQPNRVSLVRYHKRNFYVYPMAASNEAYVGNKSQYLRFKQLFQEKRAAMRSTAPDADVSSVEIVGGANPIVIREYDGWGPIFPETE